MGIPLNVSGLAATPAPSAASFAGAAGEALTPPAARQPKRQLGGLAPGTLDHSRGFERRGCLGLPFAGRR